MKKLNWEFFPTGPKAKRGYYFLLILGVVNVIMSLIGEENIVLMIIGVVLIIWSLIGLNKLEKEKATRT